MFQTKLYEIYNGMPNAFSNANDILIAGFNEQGKDHDATLDKVLRSCRQENLEA